MDETNTGMDDLLGSSRNTISVGDSTDGRRRVRLISKRNETTPTVRHSPPRTHGSNSLLGLVRIRTPAGSGRTKIYRDAINTNDQNKSTCINIHRIRQSGPRPDSRLLRQTALEVLTRSARSDSPRRTGRNKFPATIGGGGGGARAAAAAAWRREGGGGFVC
ncbi:hypothetical protein F511_18592 [Dorcoceras hygrometricum]|uniref:Uncharacterized protein n=1 Tax=Dorcoceras hygrometricum TaxID=472368 RepID=A0A2Z7DBI1_9LAMI|nr:hypothetical protein F511_18592 [Dorcoceras hygrometricum]